MTEPLVPRPVHAVNCTPAYLFRKVSDEQGLPTVLYDEIDTVFGPRAKDNEEVRGMLNAGHRKGAMAGRCVIRGKIVETEELPAYCAVALAGLDDLPDTLMTRSVVVRMRRRAPGETVEPWRLRINGPAAEALRSRLTAWTATVTDEVTDNWPTMPLGVEDRHADVWEALLSVADAAGGHWPSRARVAAVAHVADSKAASPSLGVLLLRDLRAIFQQAAGCSGVADNTDPWGEEPSPGVTDIDLANENLGTQYILAKLNGLDESPWGDIHGRMLDSRGLSRRLAKFGVKPKNVRVRGQQGVVKGYSGSDLVDPWQRYLGTEGDVGPSPYESVLSRYTATSGGGVVTPAPAFTCATCRRRIAKAKAHWLGPDGLIRCGRCIEQGRLWSTHKPAGTRAGVAWRLGLWGTSQEAAPWPDVRCPLCGAAAGSACRSRGFRPDPVKRPHVARLRAAERPRPAAGSVPIVAAASVHPTKSTRLVLVDPCPWCSKRHTHGWPYGDAEIGHRVAHCLHGSPGGYYIEAPVVTDHAPKCPRPATEWSTPIRPGAPRVGRCPSCGRVELQSTNTDVPIDVPTDVPTHYDERPQK